LLPGGEAQDSADGRAVDGDVSGVSAGAVALDLTAHHHLGTDRAHGTPGGGRRGRNAGGSAPEHALQPRHLNPWTPSFIPAGVRSVPRARAEAERADERRPREDGGAGCRVAQSLRSWMRATEWSEAFRS